jgi:2-oxoglutarate ferredoxin oxidoreductase subunit beta
MVEYDPGETKEVTMHDGSKVILKKLEHDYDPTDRAVAMRILEEANAKQWLLTGLIYINQNQPALRDIYNLTDTPLNRLQERRLRPAPESIQKINGLMF